MSTNQLFLNYKEQNKELTIQNIKLNERISILESVIEELQKDNLRFRTEKAIAIRKGVMTKKDKVSKKKTKRSNETVNTKHIVQSKRVTETINYVLPSSKSKLRKGDPFTFGNEE